MGQLDEYQKDDRAVVDPADAALQSPVIRVEVYVMGDDFAPPFIVAAYGRMNSTTLAEIEEGIREDNYFEDGPGLYRADAFYQPGQYGDEGRCELRPGWGLENIIFVEAGPLAASQEEGVEHGH